MNEDENRRPPQLGNASFIQLDFKTARGGGIQVKKEALESANVRVANILDESLEQPAATAAAAAATTTAALQKIPPMMSSPSTPNLMFSDFQTGSGKRLTVSKERVDAEEKKLLTKTDVEMAPPPVQPAPLVVQSSILQKQDSNCPQQTTAVAVDTIVKKNSLLKDAKPFKRPQFVVKKTPPPPPPPPSPPKEDLTAPLNDLFDLPVVQQLKETTIVSSSSPPCSLSSSLSSATKTPVIRFSNFHLFTADMLPARTSYLKVRDIVIENTQTGGVVVKPVLDVVSFEVEYPKVDSCPNSPILNMKCSPEVSETVESKRARALSDLHKRLQAKRQQPLSVAERSKSGSLFQVKQQQQKRKNNDLNSKKSNSLEASIKLEHLKPNKYYDISATSLDLDKLDDLKFDLSEYEHLEAEFNRNGFIQTLDSGCLVPDENQIVGVDELFNCFLDSNGVDPKLVDKIWFKNHLKWIVWKLSSYDLKFGDIFKQGRAFDPINVMSQMKYRYDVEIGNAKRSCIKRVTEKDDTLMNKLVIFFVSKVFMSSDRMIYVELSDGWYSIKAFCDCHLTSHFKNSRVRVGDKLAIFSAELVACPNDGCTPLEAPEQMHIKLSVNSTRRAKWHAKLGFVRAQRPLFATLHSIKPNTSVGAIDVYVERIYPILYCEKRDDGAKVFRNQKQEELFSYTLQERQNRSTNAALVAADMVDECEGGEMSARRSGGGGGGSDGGFENSGYGDNRRDVSQTLRIRLTDVRKNQSQKTTCVITMWKNASEFADKLNEGQRIRFFNLFSSQKNSSQDSTTISLSWSRNSLFELVNVNANNTNSVFYIKIDDRLHCPRICYEYGDLYENRVRCIYNEVDICGVVLKHSSSSASSTSAHNLVYLTNLDSKYSLVCISFPKEAEAVACVNLKYTVRKELGKYPYLIANESSVFASQRVAQRPALKFLADSFNRLVESMRALESKNELAGLLSGLEIEIRTAEENLRRFNTGVAEVSNKLNTTSSLTFQNGMNTAKSKLDILNGLSGDKKLTELPPLITKTGARHPGLVASRPSARQFQSPLVGRALNDTSTTTSSAATTNKSTYQLKRRSDISQEALLRDATATTTTTPTTAAALSTTSPKVNTVEDDEDSILLYQDIEALYKNATTSSSSSILATPMQSKRSKID